MRDEWYVARRGQDGNKRYGPVPLRQLRELLDSGRVQGEDLVSARGHGRLAGGGPVPGPRRASLRPPRRRLRPGPRFARLWGVRRRPPVSTGLPAAVVGLGSPGDLGEHRCDWRPGFRRPPVRRRYE